jgi:vancomycin resistance protein YoaR
VALPVHTVHAAGTVEQANAAKATIDRALAAPMTLNGAGSGLTITPAQIGAIVRVTPVDQHGQTTLAVTLDDAGLAKLVAQIAKTADVPVTDASVQDFGTHKVLMPSAAGVAVQQDKLAQSIRAAFVNGQHEVTVPTVTTQPKVTTEDQMAKLGITDVVAKGTSDFSGSGPARAHNVELAAYLVDGTLIAPGATFSYNDALGSILAKNFEEAGSYIDGLNGTSIGGGVCQVSTTIFRAALKGGLPITE